jgi:hypothetical protein
MLNAFAHVSKKTVRVSPDEGEQEGETFIGTIDTNGEGPNSPEGDKDNQPLFHHVEKLMIKARLLDYPKYQIIRDDQVDSPEAAHL